MHAIGRYFEPHTALVVSVDDAINQPALAERLDHETRRGAVETDQPAESDLVDPRIFVQGAQATVLRRRQAELAAFIDENPGGHLVTTLQKKSRTPVQFLKRVIRCHALADLPIDYVFAFFEICRASPKATFVKIFQNT